MKKMSFVRVLQVVLLLLAVFSGVMAGRILLRAHAEQEAFVHLASLVDPQPDPGTDTGAAHSSPYLALKEQNEDFYGWVSIEGTQLNYPVMYTPDDPQHYLRRAFDGSCAASGVPFLDGSCFAGCGNALIYGHYMRNGTMFASVASYAEESFWRAHPQIRFDTLEESGTYEIFAAFYARIYREGEAGFRYYRYTDLTAEEDFTAYVSQAREQALYDTGICPMFGDQLLTLSTCSYHTDDGRFVVVARRV